MRQAFHTTRLRQTVTPLRTEQRRLRGLIQGLRPCGCQAMTQTYLYLNKSIRKLFLILVAITESSCSSGDRQDCAKHIKEKILPGSSVGVAEAELQKCGFKTTTDPVKKTLYGDKVVQG